MIGSAPSHDHLKSAVERSKAYQSLINKGIDINESDRPIEVGNAIQPLISEKGSKQGFFKIPHIKN